MANACVLRFTEEDHEKLDAAARGENNVISPEVKEMMEKIKPQMKEALDKRFDQMMKEKNVAFVERTEEIINKGESVIQVSRDVEKEARQEINNLTQPLKSTPEERKTMREVGEKIGLSPACYVGTADIVRFPKESVKEVMAILNHPEMPRIFTRRESIGQVQYIDRFDLYVKTGIGAVTKLTDPERTDGEKTLGIFILPDEKGKVPTGKLLVGRITHEIVHGNWAMIKDYIQKQKAEFNKVIARQIEEKGLLSEYAYKTLVEATEKILEAEKRESPPPKDAEHRLLKETVAEISRLYFTDRSQLLPETQEWFKDMLQHFRGY
jgi:hypothetical protein